MLAERDNELVRPNWLQEDLANYNLDYSKLVKISAILKTFTPFNHLEISAEENEPINFLHHFQRFQAEGISSNEKDKERSIYASLSIEQIRSVARQILTNLKLDNVEDLTSRQYKKHQYEQKYWQRVGSTAAVACQMQSQVKLL